MSAVGKGTNSWTIKRFQLKNRNLKIDVIRDIWIVKVVITQSCLTLCDPMNCSPPGSSVHRIFQARVLEWVASAFSGVFCYLVENEHTHPYSSIFSVPQNRGSFIIRKFLSFLKMKSFKNKYWEIFLLLYSSAEKMMCYLRKCLFWLVRNLKQI